MRFPSRAWEPGLQGRTIFIQNSELRKETAGPGRADAGATG